jgi:hypothetical protein
MERTPRVLGRTARRLSDTKPMGALHRTSDAGHGPLPFERELIHSSGSDHSNHLAGKASERKRVIWE